MSLIATLALAVSAGSTLPQCSWDRPGVNPFMGDVAEAVDRYQDIPTATRAKLKARMKARRYDDIAVIERDAIQGQGTAAYAPEIRDMHFGPGAICTAVTRTQWAPTMQERGLVYCEDGQCILVPTVCRNVSRIRRLEAKPAAMTPGQATTVASSSHEGDATPLEFEAPGAGPMASSATPDSFAQRSGVPALGGDGTGAATGTTSLAGLDAPAPARVTEGRLPPLVTLGMPYLPPGAVRTAEFSPGVPALTPAVPEPGSWALLTAGLVMVGRRASRRTRAVAG